MAIPNHEVGRLHGDNERVLVVLEATPGQWLDRLYQRTQCMVHSRISDLRKRGYRIESRCFGKSDWRYRLLTPDATQPNEAA
jgi:hypothetical protein